jgi:hypothetical protein
MLSQGSNYHSFSTSASCSQLPSPKAHQQQDVAGRRDIDEICPSSAGTVGKLGFYGSPPRSCGVVPSKDQLWLPLVALADKSDDLGNRRCWRVTASPRSELEGLAPILVLLLVINLPNFPFSISFSNFGL